MTATSLPPRPCKPAYIPAGVSACPPAVPTLVLVAIPDFQAGPDPLINIVTCPVLAVRTTWGTMWMHDDPDRTEHPGRDRDALAGGWAPVGPYLATDLVFWDVMSDTGMVSLDEFREWYPCIETRVFPCPPGHEGTRLTDAMTLLSAAARESAPELRRLIEAGQWDGGYAL